MWEAIFAAANLLALLCWSMLIIGPRSVLSHSALMYGGIGLLCLAYGTLLILVLTGAISSEAVEGAGAAGFTSITGVRNIFLSDGGATIGWIHYLSLDLFTGLWIARDADAKQFRRQWQAPVLVLTFLAGPLGLLVWLILREPASRRAGGARARVKG